MIETNIASYPLDVSIIDGGDPNSIDVMIDGATARNATGNDSVDEASRTILGQVLDNVDNNGSGIPPSEVLP